MGYFVKVEPDVNIYVEDVNSEGNKPILWIHGWPANHKMFEYHFNRIHDKVCRFPLAVAQNQGIRNSKLVPFQYSGHGLFYDQRDDFNRELIQFSEEKVS